MLDKISEVFPLWTNCFQLITNAEIEIKIIIIMIKWKPWAPFFVLKRNSHTKPCLSDSIGVHLCLFSVYSQAAYTPSTDKFIQVLKCTTFKIPCFVMLQQDTTDLTNPVRLTCANLSLCFATWV